MVPPIVRILTFRSNNTVHRPLIEALDVLTAYADSTVPYYPVDVAVPLTGVVPPMWRDLVIEPRQRGPDRIRRVPYEICVLQALREKLRCKEIWVEGADRYRNPEDDVPHDFADQRATYYATLQLPMDATTFITDLHQELEDALQMLNDGLPTNATVRITEKQGGWIEVTPLTAQPAPPNLDPLKAELAARWGMTSLLTMLHETDARIGFTDCFTSLTHREHLDRSSCLYSHIQTCAASEVIAMIQGVLRHCTNMAIEQQYVNSHGQSEVAFGLSRLLGFDLLPRLRPLHRQKVSMPSAAHAQRYPHLSRIQTRPINWALIRQQYDELVKYASALPSGIADAEAILRRFTRNAGHATYKAMAELGRVMKTIFLCRYLHQESLRREIHEGLNVIENWNSANSFIFYGRQGDFATNRRDEQEVAMLAMHVIQNSLVYVNTLMIQDVFAEPVWLARMTTMDLRALTPLIYQHVNPYGTFHLDLNQRLPFFNEQAA